MIELTEEQRKTLLTFGIGTSVLDAFDNISQEKADTLIRVMALYNLYEPKNDKVPNKLVFAGKTYELVEVKT